ncbi:L-histidine N(alpha)-methyltransferase [Sinimarinibacterium sp. CAU 1509]|uniref:L-histidine N(alpha)-methyltransferase n=1 Tax=Sinimarinibacterium sp. CAU 1509 TaxID=2562283 RepID=UPI0010ACF5F9|nr:L-histidine N(alpha)-methyltransferase [Sinimarinibacterium sp. CAU 1509]TJY63221.1 L-histidine N(alpha)-methyltransferase [Sinimarinibacterium sp. CAU 1509]
MSAPAPRPRVRADIDRAFLEDVVAGLSATPKTLPSKYFYDAAGSELFERICELPEYYPTRTERALLQQHADAMADALGPRVLLIEPGAGSGEKTQLLLQALDRPAAYVPVDISGEYLAEVAHGWRSQFPHIEVLPVAADFTQAFSVPRVTATPSRRVVFFPGSTLGNFEPSAARQLLSAFRKLAGEGGRLLLGVDLQKDVSILERAYDDAAGVTAAFNRNLLMRINRELGGRFDLDSFAHVARYDDTHHRIEMHLRSTRDQVVSVAGTAVRFRSGETIHTENSYKYTPESVRALAAAAGWRAQARWLDPDCWFGVFLFAA